MVPFQVGQPLVLLLLPPLVVFVVLVWQRSTHPPRSVRTRLLLGSRLVGVAALILALAEISFHGSVSRQAVVFVADVSSSTDTARQSEQDFIARAIAAKQPDDGFAVVTTAQQALVDHVFGTLPDFDVFHTSVASDGTDLAAGLRLAGAMLPSAYRTRVVLLSDGHETTGDAAEQARLLQARGVETDVVPLSISAGPEVLLDQVAAPTTVQADERFSIDVRAESTVQTLATVQVYLDDQLVDTQSVTLQPGITQVTSQARTAAVGLHELRATIAPEIDTLPQNNQATAIVEVQGAPRVLVIEQRPGEGANIAAALAGAGMQVETRAPADLPTSTEELGSYNTVVLADVSADSLNDQQMELLRSYVHDLGRGLVAIGGESSYGQGDYAGTPLDDVLPVSSTVRGHRDQGRVAMMLVIDHSGSMADDPKHEGTPKIVMARQAATLAVDQLAPGDEVGILAFDSNNHWIVPMTHVDDVGVSAIDAQINTLNADGGTNIPPAVSEGLNALEQAGDAEYRHMILMTDGMSCCGGDYTPLLDRMKADNVTLSTIAVGADADQDLLTRLAKLGGGRYYFADRAADIPRFMTRETKLATRGPLVEGNMVPVLSTADPVVVAASQSGMPALTGYLVTTPRDLAEVLLKSPDDDPVLARWQYGLGRAVAFTSDLRGRWSADWLAWPGEQRLLAGVTGWTIPQTQGGLRVDLRTNGGTAEVTVEENQPASSPGQVQVSVVGPGGSTQSVDLLATGPGQFEGSFPTPAVGAYLAHVQDVHDGQVAAAADAGLAVPYSPEYRTLSTDVTRLQQIARAGGGHVLNDPSAAFASDLVPAPSDVPLTRPMLLLAVLLVPLEVALRRLRLARIGFLDRVPARKATLRSLRPFGVQPGRWRPAPFNRKRAASEPGAPAASALFERAFNDANGNNPYRVLMEWQLAKRARAEDQQDD
ncbi:MAG: VWA domain-containing protein [Chloroflexi bacterium]|nr:VWA domain-containing protein [Chloroflexota bacterium]